jgi:hypothetical protein
MRVIKSELRYINADCTMNRFTYRETVEILSEALRTIRFL